MTPRLLLLSIIAGQILALLICQKVFAGPKIEISYGWAQGTVAPNGIWWEHQFPTDNQVSSPTWSIGISDKVWDQWGIRTDFSRLLTFRTRNVAIPNEHMVDALLSGKVSCADSWQYCLTKWNGDGEAYGIHLGVFREFRLSSMRLQPEIGVLPYHYHFNMMLEPLEPGALSGQAPGDVGSSNAVTGYARLTMLISSGIFLRVDYDHNVKGHAPVVGIQQGKIIALSFGYQF